MERATSEKAGDRALRRIVVFGGGIAGWLSALVCARILHASEREIVLVETPALRTLGVGEATASGFLSLIAHAGVDPQLLMRRCSVRPRLATRFDGWLGGGRAIWCPCATSRLSGVEIETLTLLARIGDIDAATRSLADFSPHVRLCRGGLDPSPLALATLAHGLHLDADSCVQLLRDVAASAGIRQLFGTVNGMRLDPSGAIERVDIGGARSIEADLFIDATGSGDIATAAGDAWIAWPEMPYDRSVALPLPRDSGAPCFTISSAGPGGHVWRLPMVHRTGLGYTYSSASTGDDAAIECLVENAGLHRRRTADPRRLAFTPGRRTLFWRGNCLSVGSAACCIDPVLVPECHVIEDGLNALRETFARGVRSWSKMQMRYNALMDEATSAARLDAQLSYFMRARDPADRDDAHFGPLAARLGAYDRMDPAGMRARDAYLLSAAGRYPRTANTDPDHRAIAEIDVLLDHRLEATDGMIAAWQSAS